MKYIYIKTHFPKSLDYKLNFDKQTVTFITNDINKNDGKVTVSEATYFMNKLIEDNQKLITELFIQYPKIKYKKDKVVKFKDYFVCLEDFRNISYGFIDSLINDSTCYSLNKIGDFGFLCGITKPLRLKFIEMSKKHAILEYYSTPKYNPNNPEMIKFNAMKKYKYLIDLPGHSYSTKIYSYLHCKRVIFRVKDRSHPFYWEKYLKPDIHFIEVKNDFSDLIEKYEFLEKNPEIYDKIVKNCDDLVKNKINQEFLTSNFLKELFRVIT